jgi:hypothetical protein
MNRLLIPLALVVLVAGCAMPNLFGQQADQPVVADTAQTVVVREIYHETPVVYVDTVYMASDPAPVQPVYVENEYNEYNETNVYVHKQVVVPPPRREPGWSPREPERRPADRRRDDGSSRDRNKPGGSDKPGPVNPKQPVKKTDAPAVNDRQQAPVPPTQPAKPVPPKRQAPVGSVQVTQVQNEAPKQVPAPSVDKPAASASAGVQVSLAQTVRK